LTWLPNAVPPLPVPCVARAAFAALVIVPAGVDRADPVRGSTALWL